MLNPSFYYFRRKLNPPIYQSKRARFFATYHRKQNFALSDSIIYYATKNPLSPKCYGKMIQSCKHFFIQNSILVISFLHAYYKNNKWNLSFKDNSVALKDVKSKIWLTFGLRISNAENNERVQICPIIPKIYRNDLEEVTLCHQIISLSYFKFLASKCEKVHLWEVIVTDEASSVFTLEKIIAILTEVKMFRCDLGHIASSLVTAETVQNLLQIPHFSNLSNFNLIDIPEIFDIDTLFDYIKKNKTIDCYLSFDEQISEAHKIRLQTIVNEIIASKNRDYEPPLIEFPDNDRHSFDQLHDLCY